jgi:thiol-disulfide isomerase/thioredoxin
MLSFSIGPFALSLNHLLLLASLGLASLAGWLTARRWRADNPEAILFRLFLLGLVCARAAFVFRYWAQYREDPWQIPDIRDGGFLLWPGLIAVLLAAAVQAWRRPTGRRPLIAGLASGLLFWWLGNLGSQLYTQDGRLPEVALSNAAGEPVSLRKFAGQPLVVNLWATWCPPCRREMPVLVQAQRRYPQVRFVFVNQGETPQTVAGFAGASGLDLAQVLFDGQGALGRSIGSVALPTTLFYSADGRLAGHHLGELSAASLDHALEVFRQP